MAVFVVSWHILWLFIFHFFLISDAVRNRYRIFKSRDKFLILIYLLDSTASIFFFHLNIHLVLNFIHLMWFLHKIQFYYILIEWIFFHSFSISYFLILLYSVNNTFFKTIKLTFLFGIVQRIALVTLKKLINLLFSYLYWLILYEYILKSLKQGLLFNTTFLKKFIYLLDIIVKNLVFFLNL